MLFLYIISYMIMQSFYDSGENHINLVHGRYTHNISNFRLAVPQRVHSDGSFYTHYLEHHFSDSVRKKRTLEEDRIHYLLKLEGHPHILELEPHAEVTAPSLVVERRSKGSSLDGVTFHHPRRHLCHFRGHVRGESGSKVALSTCDGLVGFVKTQNGTYLVEPLHGRSPVEGEEHVHVVYKRETVHSASCGLKTEDWWSQWCTMLQAARLKRSSVKRSETGTSVQRWYELMVVTDKQFLTFHRDHDVEEYIICIMNMVAEMFHDQSVGSVINIVIVRIVFLEKEEQELDLSISTDGEDTLDSFCKWQNDMNFKDINHPNHHDAAVLITRHNICSDDDGTCGLLGLAHMGTACDPQRSCSINEDSGLLLGFTITHELGHTLSCGHDSPDESGCEPVAPAGDSTVMNPVVKSETSAWSPCSRAFITGLFDSQLGECLLDEPQVHSYPLDEMPPGAFYGADEQCAFLFGPSYTNYDTGGDKFCELLWCKAKEADSCTSMSEPPAEGTKCAPNKWCFNKECITVGERPKAVNGEWGDWGPWSGCSRTCGGGVTVRERLCNNPLPSNKGRFCLGKHHEYDICNSKVCPPGLSFRDAQCAEFNAKPYQGVLHQWKSYSSPDTDPSPCALHCLNEEFTLAKLAARVKDGTRCKPGTKDTCVQGNCLLVGCDWKMGSDAVEDVCGICDGDGTHCTIVYEIYKDAPQQGYIPLATAPAGALNVRLEEVKPSDNMVAVSAIDNRTFYLNGNYTEYNHGSYSFGNTQGIYLRPQENMDELHIKGPLTEPLVLYICLFSKINEGVRYMFSIPSDKPMYTPSYHWEFVEWGPCSACCGGGTQLMKNACIEERDGKVKASFCSNLPKEEPRARTCNDQPCLTRWKVWKWGPCSGCIFQSGIRTRKVECIRQNPTTTGDEEIITDPWQCCGPPPKKTELCNSPRPCPKNVTSGIMKRAPIFKPIDKSISKRAEGSISSNTSNVNNTDIVRDRVKPESVHLLESVLQDGGLNLTEREFVELGNEVPEQVLGCVSKVLSGKAAVERLSEILQGPGHHNATAVKNKEKLQTTTPVADNVCTTTKPTETTTECTTKARSP